MGGSEERAGPRWTAHLFLFLHSHGGTGCGSAHKPFLASRASVSSPSSTVSPGACLHTTNMRQP